MAANDPATKDAMLKVYLDYLEDVKAVTESQISIIHAKLDHKVVARSEWKDFPVRPANISITEILFDEGVKREDARLTEAKHFLEKLL